MKLHFAPVLLSLATALFVNADPILPYQQPIFQQITNDLEMGTGNATALNKALTTYERNSKSLSGDIGILRDLNNLLADEPNYPALLANAISSYTTDFEGRRDALREQLRPAPRTTTKTSAQSLLRKIDRALGTAEIATATSAQIKALADAAAKIPTASNTIQRALRAPVGLSSMVAKIGALKFNATRGFIAGGTNFQTGVGATIGEFEKGLAADSGVLTVSGIDNGSIVRGIHMHVEGITTNTPATYPLGVGENSVFYDATDVQRRREYHFQGNPSLTNTVVTNALLTIDYIGASYMLGRFAFIGTNIHPVSITDTNTLVTVSEGEFQLNFNH
jgi:hypothetical protein